MEVFLRFFIYSPKLTSLLGAPIAALMCMLCRRKTERRRWEWVLIATLFTVPVSLLCGTVILWLESFIHVRYDEYIFCFDAFFGSPSFKIGQFVTQHLWLESAAWYTYDGLANSFLAVFIVYLWMRSEREAVQMLWTFILNLILAVPIYALVPVCGPHYAFAGFPFDIPMHLVPHVIRITAPPNGVPSVHMSTALIILWFARRWRITALLGIVDVVLIVISTMGSGEHYLFDLLAAFPYTALILYLGQLDLKRVFGVRSKADERTEPVRA